MRLSDRVITLACAVASGVVAYHHEDPDGISGVRWAGGDWVSITLTIVTGSLLYLTFKQVPK